MGRKKKVKTAILKKHKKAINKNKPSNKPAYISKADRAKLSTDTDDTIE